MRYMRLLHDASLSLHPSLSTLHPTPYTLHPHARVLGTHANAVDSEALKPISVKLMCGTVGEQEDAQILVRYMRLLHDASLSLFPPSTLHSPAYTLHPGPYTLHPTTYTLQPTPYTLRPTPFTLHPTPNAPHPAPHTPGGGRARLGALARGPSSEPLHISEKYLFLN